MSAKKIRNLKIVQIPIEFRDENSKKLAVQAARDVFGPLFHTLNSQNPTQLILIAKRRLTHAYDAYEAVINATYDQVFSPGETTLETIRRFN